MSGGAKYNQQKKLPPVEIESGVTWQVLSKGYLTSLFLVY